MSLTPKKTLRCIVLYEWIAQGGKNKQQWFHLAVGSSESQFWSPSHAWKRGRCDETQMHNCSRCQSCKNKTLTYCTWAHEWFSTLRFPLNNELMDHLGSTKTNLRQIWRCSLPFDMSNMSMAENVCSHVSMTCFFNRICHPEVSWSQGNHHVFPSPIPICDAGTANFGRRNHLTSSSLIRETLLVVPSYLSCVVYNKHNRLVVDLPLWKIFVSWVDYSQYYMEK